MCASDAPLPPPSLRQMADEWACAFPSWHSIPALHSATLRSIVLPLPPEFVSFLLADGVFVGDASNALPKRSEVEDSEDDDMQGGWARDYTGPRGGSNRVSMVPGLDCSSSDSSEEEEEEGEQQDWFERFPELHQSIEAAVRQLGGQVVPKLNWSCPLDATWVNPLSSLACTNADQVVLMLKSSDRIAHDLELLSAAAPPAPPAGAGGPRAQPPGPPAPSTVPTAPPTEAMHSTPQAATQTESPAAPQAVLVLRQWYDLRPEREWRCFVARDRLVGVCQRDITQHFPQLAERVGSNGMNNSRRGAGSSSSGSESSQSEVEESWGGDDEVTRDIRPGQEAKAALRALRSFHDRTVRRRFPLSNYTYDTYVTTGGTVKVLDFNPVGGTTSPLLFTWPELGLEEAARAADEAILQANGAPDTPAQQGQGANTAVAAEQQQGPPAAVHSHGHGPCALPAEVRPPEHCGLGAGSRQTAQSTACTDGQGDTGPSDEGHLAANRSVPSSSHFVHPAPSSSQSQDGRAAQRQSPGELQTGRQQSCPGSESSASSSRSSSSRRGGRRVLLRIVPEASMVQPGHKAVCSMPVDMNSLQESIEGMARLTQQRR